MMLELGHLLQLVPRRRNRARDQGIRRRDCLEGFTQRAAAHGCLHTAFRWMAAAGRRATHVIDLRIGPSRDHPLDSLFLLSFQKPKHHKSERPTDRAQWMTHAHSKPFGHFLHGRQAHAPRPVGPPLRAQAMLLNGRPARWPVVWSLGRAVVPAAFGCARVVEEKEHSG